MEMHKDRKKEISIEYKQRKTTGGVYRITNTANGNYMIQAEVDLQSFRNRFEFMQKTRSCLHPKLQKDYNKFGAEVFTLEFLQEVEMKEDESPMGFKDRLKNLEETWAEKYEAAKAY